MIRVFSGDGGGVFGTVPAYQLKDYNIQEEFDVLGGCSISSALVAGYSMGMTGLELLKSMEVGLPQIFCRSWYSWMNPFGSKWPVKELTKWCKKNFDVKLGEINKPIFIVAMDFSHRRPKVFSNTDPRDVETPLYEAVLASVSAPTYFPPAGVYVDGGLFANNPSVVTCAGASNALGVDMDEINLFSIGTGKLHKKPIDMKKASEWNVIGWASRIIPVMLEGGNEVGMEFIARQLPLNSYVRSNMIDLDGDWEMDDPSLMPELILRTKMQQNRFEEVMNKFLKDSKK